MANNIFGNQAGGEKKGDAFQNKVDTHSKAILTVIERQKDVESSLDLLNEKLELVDHNSIKNFKKIFNDVKAIRSDVREVKQELKKIQEYNTRISKQMSLFTTKDEVTKLEKYIDLWNPMGFVTRDELEENNKKQIDTLKEIVKKFLIE